MSDSERDKQDEDAAAEDAKEDLELNEDDADQVRGGAIDKEVSPPSPRTSRSRRTGTLRVLADLRERLERVGYDEERVDRLVRDDGGLGLRRRARGAPA